ncbi:uncharacterized protein LOC121106709 isoform X1 [Gallus gallus]|uniref:uncharacterized protein LOC121106709 isoform X1 n=1 Tax=Gallus gallus TaxID=9031 RepID=UPI001AE7BA3B|nr:uncharacterized protein LOC121106709 isoform X1 [Gallus gallus]
MCWVLGHRHYSGTCSGCCAGGGSIACVLVTMVPGHLLLLFLLVALEASGIQAAPWRRSRADVPPERAFPALPRPPALDPLDPRWHPRAVLVGDKYRVLWPSPPHVPQGDSEDVAVGDGYPAFQLRSSAEPPGDHMDMPSEKAPPALPRPPVPNPRWHPRGTPRARYTATRGKKSPETSEVLEKAVKKLVQIEFGEPPGFFC